MKHIVIMFHEFHRQRQILLIHALSAAWKKMGLRVSFIYGIDKRPEADLLFPQIDLTHTPDEYVDFYGAYPGVINRCVTDISKRRISLNLLREDEDYQGPVIVKTDNNASGIPDYSKFKIHKLVFWRIAHRILPVAEYLSGRQMLWRKTLIPYLIYNNLSKVPAGVFKNHELVVERFLPEREGERFFMRHYLCLGDKVRSVRVSGFTPFLKRSECKLVDEGLVPPDEVVALRRCLGLDYGKIDYVINNGQVIILDVNRTPGLPGTPDATALTVNDLADGIWSLLDKA
ncbi:MAG: hypothetical protein ABSC11_07410 [Smithella sp.]|jgi:hypothetical protein